MALILPFSAHAGVKLRAEPGHQLLISTGTQRTYLRIGLEGMSQPVSDRAPVNVALVLDRSGSMQGQRIKQAKAAVSVALNHLRPADTVAVVAYDNTAATLAPAQPFLDRHAIEAAVSDIQAGGSTALFAGVELGAEEIGRHLSDHRINRIVLLSDGIANIGPSTPVDMARLGKDLAEEGISVTTIGLGLGYNEDLMSVLADASDGNHAFVESPADLARIFQNEFGELTSAVAGDVEIIIDCRHGVRPLRILGRNALIEGSRVIAKLNRVTASQEKYLLLEVEVPPGSDGSERDLAGIQVNYTDLSTKTKSQLSGEVRVGFTQAADKAEASVNRNVMVSASEQIGAEMDSKAIELKDKGDVQAAGAVLREKSEFLSSQASKLNSERLQEQGERAKAAESAVAAPAASDVWSRARKAMRSDQFGVQKQQSYR